MPVSQREAAYALGATRWEAIRMALYYARSGIIGAIMLGLGRALGETMAVTMVIGNSPQISRVAVRAPVHDGGVIANEFTEAADDLYLAALVEIGLVLFVITIVVNALSRLLIWSVSERTRGAPARGRPSRRWRPEHGARGHRHDARRKLLSRLVGWPARRRSSSRSSPWPWSSGYVLEQGCPR